LLFSASRRRHTRFSRDWSSDVCSSDLHDHIAKNIKSDGVKDRGKKRANFHVLRESNMSAILFEYLFIDYHADRNKLLNVSFRDKIGRASCRYRWYSTAGVAC